ncbi:MAG: holo-ACP synthase [Clostridiales bacterium]|nr:holo-ACP synthase [Clostridiales bacterium]
MVTGIDLVENERMKKSIENERFVQRVFGEREREELSKRNFPLQSMSAAFAAKEAFLKAIGTGLSGAPLNEIEVLHEKSGKPYLFLSGKAKEIAEQMHLTLDLSLTHTENYAAAVVVGTMEV